jgi:hypothetical protein
MGRGYFQIELAHAHACGFAAPGSRACAPEPPDGVSAHAGNDLWRKERERLRAPPWRKARVRFAAYAGLPIFRAPEEGACADG